MSEEEIKDIQDLIERKILLANVSGGLTSSDKKVIDLWNYTVDLKEENSQLKERIEKAIEYIEKDTRWFDSEYASIYGTLCTCAGAKDDRLEVMVNPSNLLEILKRGTTYE